MKLGTTQLWVHDQEEALAFYTEKVGLEVRTDVTMPELGFRWLTVAAPGQDVDIVLMAIPPEPVMDSNTADQVREVMSKGFGGTVFLVTDDVRKDYEAMQERGVEFTSAPEEQPYGIDCSFRDPSGNSIRLGEITADLG